MLSSRDNGNRKAMAKSKCFGEQKDKEMKVNRELNEILKIDGRFRNNTRDKVKKNVNEALFVKGK
jgi:hypothetical protein